MKKYWSTETYAIRNTRRAHDSDIARQEYLAWRVRHNRWKNSQPKFRRASNTTNNDAQWYHQYRPFEITVPEVLDIRTNPEPFVEFIESIRAAFKLKNYDAIRLNFNKCIEIDGGTLLIVRDLLTDPAIQPRLPATGNYPSAQTARYMFDESEFTKYFFVKDQNSNSRNRIVTTDTNTYFSSSRSGPLDPQDVEKIVNFCRSNSDIVGTHCDGLVTVLSELIHNTLGHAKGYPRGTQKEAAEGVMIERVGDDIFSHSNVFINQSIDRIEFAFVDYGVGIMKTMGQKYSEMIVGLLDPTKEVTILREVFENGMDFARSSSKETNRGGGLHAIWRRFEGNQVESLVVLTNNVFLNFQTGEFFRLKHHFSGTAVLWHYSHQCQLSHDIS